MDDKRALLRHFLAALAYRTQKALRDAPGSFEGFKAGQRVRTPAELVRHMSEVLAYARTCLDGKEYRPGPESSFDEEVEHLHSILEDLGRHLASDAPMMGTTEEVLLQGPLSDAMTHAGQLALLRRLAGSPVPPENFMKADVDPSNLGPDQPGLAGS